MVNLICKNVTKIMFLVPYQQILSNDENLVPKLMRHIPVDITLIISVDFKTLIVNVFKV